MGSYFDNEKKLVDKEADIFYNLYVLKNSGDPMVDVEDDPAVDAGKRKEFPFGSESGLAERGLEQVRVSK